MEVLLAACLLAWVAGAQSEQAKLGISPAQREIMREQTRHDKAVRQIAEKHGTTVPQNPVGVSPWKEPPAAATPVTIPEAFRSGYRSHTPVARVATPIGRHAGHFTATGVGWVKDTGRGALRQYRKSRRAAGQPDPAPVLVPVPVGQPTLVVPPMPTHPPTVGGGSNVSGGVTLVKPEVSDGTTEPTADDTSTTAGAPEASTVPEETTDGPAVASAPTAPEPEPATAGTADTTTPQDVKNGAGRMAAEVTYESVMEESDELSIMCDDDVRVYDRIRARAEREIGRGDALIAAAKATGLGEKVIAWVVRCKENYGVIHAEVDDLQQNTIAQGEAVVKAKALLEAGQGVYADIAKDMEDVAEREAYISDAVDAEDTQAHTEVYETKAA
jgi:hypothetical protein